MENAPGTLSAKDDDQPAALIDQAAWSDVLAAVDKTWAELVSYQEQLEARNAELTSLRRFVGSVMGSMSDYLVAVNRGGIIEDASASFLDMAGGADLLPEDAAFADYLTPEDRPAFSAALARALAGAGAEALELHLVTAKGEAEPVEFRIAPRLDRRRKGVGAVLTGRPLGELRRMYASLAESHEALLSAQTQLVRNEKLASLGRLLAGVAHELNNPISFVYANTHALDKYLNRFEAYFEQVQAGASRAALIELRKELRLDRDLRNLREALSGVRDGAERVRDIVEDLRRLSADGDGAFVEFDLAETARIAANWVARGDKSGAALSFEGETSCMVTGNAGHIQQVIMNLVQNAMDAASGEGGKVRIRISLEGAKAHLDVIDNGPGVPADQATAIFDPFFTTKPVGKGTGLGLPISLKIMEEHGGVLHLLDHDGPGAGFRLSLGASPDGSVEGAV